MVFLIKIVISVVVLDKWVFNYCFIICFYIDGFIYNGVLEGNLFVVGDYDFFFVWEEAIVVGNVLN